MGRQTIQQLRQQGVSQEDIDMALQTQAAQRRNGSPVQSLAVICGVAAPRKRSATVTDINERALRNRGAYDKAALLLDQQALRERSPERALRAREIASFAKELSSTEQLEFDFFGGNVSIAFQYQDAVTERLFTEAKTTAQAKEALSILWTICRHLSWQNYACTKNAAELCKITRTGPAHMSRALELLERVGAIHRVKRGRAKIITVTPEGAFRGDVRNHGEAVERFKLDVIQGGKAGDS